MTRKFPLFMDISNKKISVYGAGRIASRRVETLLAFAPLLTVFAPEASDMVKGASEEGKLVYRKQCYVPGSIGRDNFMVLAATDDSEVNEQIYRECREKDILVNVCSNRKHCDFQFPGVAVRDELVIGINAGGTDHHLAKKWTEKIRREVEKDGYDDQTQEAQDHSES